MGKGSYRVEKNVPMEWVKRFAGSPYHHATGSRSVSLPGIGKTIGYGR
ncbi:MAG: hypothetical protein LUQ69_06890 [Methanoregulaceae archaeon]|nr:hypothetical protein [Methanoregulaceae archaeon]